MSAYVPRSSIAVAASLALMNSVLAQQATTVFTASCDNVDIDLRNNHSVCTHVAISNGTISILADRGTTDESDFDDSQWQFDGNVFIEFESASLSADRASFEFARNELVYGELTGSPVEIRDRLEEQDVDLVGTANRIAYDNRDGTARLAGEASITLGGNEYLGCDLVYNLNEKTFKSGTSDCGVRVRIIPNEGEESGADDSSAQP
jgi:lipopolysaccharide transport protein LptA